MKGVWGNKSLEIIEPSLYRLPYLEPLYAHLNKKRETR